MKKRVTQKDIALACNLTVDAVSKALRNSNEISATTKDRVKKIADSLGYIPNDVAVNLKSKTTNTIGVISGSTLNSYYSIMSYYINVKLIETGYNCLTKFNNDDDALFDALRDLISKNITAIICFQQLPERHMNLIKKFNIPTIVVGSLMNDSYIHSIATDDTEGVFLATEHLIEKGKKNICFFASRSNHSTLSRRILGYENAMKKHNLTPICKLMNTHNYANEFELFVKDNPTVESVICYNDVIAYSILPSFKKLSHAVDIFGFDELNKELPFQKINTIGSNKRAIISTALDILIKQINNPEAYNHAQHVLAPTYLSLM